VKIREVLSLAAENLGREDLKAEIDDLAGDPEGELKSLLRCYRLVENEIALDYFPLKCTETVTLQNGAVEYAVFRHSPVRILRVTAAGRDVPFCTDALSLSVETDIPSVTVHYCYVPDAGEWTGDVPFGGAVSARLLSFGIACEFCLGAGQYSDAAMWEKRYREALQAANIVRRKLGMRSRRWV